MCGVCMLLQVCIILIHTYSSGSIVLCLSCSERSICLLFVFFSLINHYCLMCVCLHIVGVAQVCPNGVTVHKADMYIAVYTFSEYHHCCVVPPCSQHGQDTTDELRSKDYKHSLERKEKEARDQRQRERAGRAFTGRDGLALCLGCVAC